MAPTNVNVNGNYHADERINNGNKDNEKLRYGNVLALRRCSGEQSSEYGNGNYHADERINNDNKDNEGQLKRYKKSISAGLAEMLFS